MVVCCILRATHLRLVHSFAYMPLYGQVCQTMAVVHKRICTVERNGSGVELLDYENAGSNPGCGVKTLGKLFHSTLLQFTQLYK